MPDHNPENIDNQAQDDNSVLVKGLLYAMVTVAILMLGYLYFDKALKKQHNPNQAPVTSTDQGSKTIVLQRNKYGHYVSNGTINGKQVQFFVDTGATHVSIPADIAKKLDLKRGPSHRVSTANGSATAYATTLNTIAIGGIKMRHVQASISPSFNSDEILLGMSFLKDLEFSQTGDQLTIRQVFY